MDYSQVAISNVMQDLRTQNSTAADLGIVRHMILNSIRKWRQKFYGNYGELVIACDGPKYWRKDFFPEYKESRKKKRNQDIDWDSVYTAVNTVKEELKTFFPYAVIDVEGAEGDDVIGSLVKWTQTNDLVDNGLEFGPQPVMIVSGDHDFVQLQKYDNVQQYSPTKEKKIKPDCPVGWFLTEHILSGDDGDGIPNYLSDPLTFVTEGLRQKGISKKLMADEWRKRPLSEWLEDPVHGARVRQNKTLIDLSEIPTEVEARIIEKYLSDRSARGRGKIFSYMMAQKLRVLSDAFGDF